MVHCWRQNNVSVLSHLHVLYIPTKSTTLLWYNVFYQYQYIIFYKILNIGITPWKWPSTAKKWNAGESTVQSYILYKCQYFTFILEIYGTAAPFELQSFPHQHVSLRSVLQVFGFPYSIFLPFSRVCLFHDTKHPQCITHPVYHLQLQRESGTYSGGVSSVVSSQINKHLVFLSYFLCKNGG